MEYKQVILVRQDLKLDKGKMAAQAAHASVESVLRSDKEIIKNWNQQAKDLGLKTALITDAGKTHIAPGTITCLGIGPDNEEKIDKVTKDLKIF